MSFCRNDAPTGGRNYCNYSRVHTNEQSLLHQPDENLSKCTIVHCSFAVAARASSLQLYIASSSNFQLGAELSNEELGKMLPLLCLFCLQLLLAPPAPTHSSAGAAPHAAASSFASLPPPLLLPYCICRYIQKKSHQEKLLASYRPKLAACSQPASPITAIVGSSVYSFCWFLSILKGSWFTKNSK